MEGWVGHGAGGQEGAPGNGMHVFCQEGGGPAGLISARLIFCFASGLRAGSFLQGLVVELRERRKGAASWRAKGSPWGPALRPRGGVCKGCMTWTQTAVAHVCSLGLRASLHWSLRHRVFSVPGRHHRGSWRDPSLAPDLPRQTVRRRRGWLWKRPQGRMHERMWRIFF